MPSYHNWGGSAHHTRMPLTPPEYQTSYMDPMSAVSDQTFYKHQSYPKRSNSSRDYSERYHQGTGLASQAQYTTQYRSRTEPYVAQQDFYNQGYPVIPQYQYGATAANVLPPIRVNDSIDRYAASYQTNQVEAKPKEEKPTGGVAQHLDYEMDLMASFVAEMAQKLVYPSNSPSAQFRKYVSQILSSTRLPSSTIMLGLFYLASRMKIVRERGQSTSSSGTVYRMLTTCLLLGSKFLDDNTFQNRSWAEVSSIAVQELNLMELDWLTDFNWEIHNMMYQDQEGFFEWIDHWHAYEQKVQAVKVKEMQKLSPLDTSAHRSRSTPSQPLMSPEGPIPPQYQQGPQFDTQWVRPYISDYSPPSAPHSGPATPDYYSNTWSYAQTPLSFSNQPWCMSATPGYNQSRGQLSGYNPTMYHFNTYTPQAWAGHGSNCGCTLCAKHPEYYFNQHGYVMQTVVG